MKLKCPESLLTLENIFPWNLAIDVYQARDQGLGKRMEALAFVYAPGLMEAMDTLAHREQQILRMRYQEGKTYEQIGKEYSVTRERVRQIEAMALRKLRHPARMELYRPVTVEQYNELRRDYWELKARYERVKADAVEEALRNMCDSESQIMEIRQENAEQRLATPLGELELSVRSYNCLLRAGFKTVGDLVGVQLEEFMRVRNLGRRSLEEILDRLSAFGIVPRYANGDTYEIRHRRKTNGGEKH